MTAIKVHGFSMAYDDTGGALPPLVLLHGFPLDRTLWAVQVRDLAEVARVIAPDLRGLGESGLPGGAVTLDDYADDARALLDALGIKTAVIAGLSMGGYIAFAFYRKYAHRVRALILADTRAGEDSAEGKRGRDANIALAQTQGVSAVAENMFPKMLTPQTVSQNVTLASATRGMMNRQSVAGVVAALAAMRDRLDATPLLAEITVPTLILVGAEDAVTPPSQAELMRDAIRGSRLVTLAGAAHLSNLDQPAEFNQAVREFLRTVA